MIKTHPNCPRVWQYWEASRFVNERLIAYELLENINLDIRTSQLERKSLLEQSATGDTVLVYAYYLYHSDTSLPFKIRRSSK